MGLPYAGAYLFVSLFPDRLLAVKNPILTGRIVVTVQGWCWGPRRGVQPVADANEP